MKSETEISKDGGGGVMDADDSNGGDTTLVTAIKIGVQRLQEELERDEDLKTKDLENGDSYRQKVQKCSNPQTIDCVINYLEEILQKIIATYQSHNGCVKPPTQKL